MENKKNFIINVLYYAVIIGLVYLFCNYLLGIFVPFILGFVLAYFAVRIAKKIFKEESKIKRVIALLILYLVILIVISILIVLGVNEISGFIGALPNIFKQYVEPVLQNLTNNTNLNLPANVNNDLNGIYTNLLDSIRSIISSVSSFIVSGGKNIISGTTNILVSCLTTIITSFFAVYDYEDIIWYFESIMSASTKKVYDEVKNYFINTVFLVVRSYATIMFITFIELLIGLGILGIDNFILISMITCVLDILPILGVGTVLIPWGLFELLIGNIGVGIGLIVLYLVITVVRQIVEPKMVGGSLGLHPLAALFSMLVGMQLFGFIGLFGLPLVISFFVKRKKELSQI